MLRKLNQGEFVACVSVIVGGNLARKPTKISSKLSDVKEKIENLR